MCKSEVCIGKKGFDTKCFCTGCTFYQWNQSVRAPIFYGNTFSYAGAPTPFIKIYS